MIDCEECRHHNHDHCDGTANEPDYVNDEWTDRKVECSCECREPLTRAEIYKLRKLLSAMS